MDLQTIAIVAAIASPLLTAAVAWGTIRGRLDARLQAVDEKAVQAYQHADRAHQRIDALT
jgi:hypothetical protein